MDDNIKHLFIGIVAFIYGYISYKRHKKWHKEKFGFSDEWDFVLVKSKGIIVIGIILIIIQLLRIIGYLE